jgi:hypothetical protein
MRLLPADPIHPGPTNESTPAVKPTDSNPLLTGDAAAKSESSGRTVEVRAFCSPDAGADVGSPSASARPVLLTKPTASTPCDSCAVTASVPASRGTCDGVAGRPMPALRLRARTRVIGPVRIAG